MSEKEEIEDITKTTPFTTQVILYGPGGKTSCFQANVDDGAMVNVMDLRTFKKAANNHKKLVRSNQNLRMANRSIVPSQGIWKGMFQWNKIKVCTSFEIFDSGSVWSMIIGKPLLEQLGAIHDYSHDTIIIPHHPTPVIIRNIYGTPAAPMPKKLEPNAN